MQAARALSVARKAAAVYTALFGVGSVLSIKHDYPAEALGIKTGWSTKKGVLSGIHGAGLAAPWHMILQMWVAIRLADAPGVAGRRGRAWLAFLAAMFIAGSVAEPVSHKIVTRDLPPGDMTVAVGNVVIPAVVLVAALVSLTDTSDAKSPVSGVSK